MIQALHEPATAAVTAAGSMTGAMAGSVAGSVRADLLDTAETALSDIRTVLISLVLVGAAWLLFRVFWQTKAITACLIALLTGGFVYFGVENVEWLGERVSEQIRQWSAPASAEEDAPPSDVLAYPGSPGCPGDEQVPAPHSDPHPSDVIAAAASGTALPLALPQPTHHWVGAEHIDELGAGGSV